jgi:hypothetical protein
MEEYSSEQGAAAAKAALQGLVLSTDNPIDGPARPVDGELSMPLPPELKEKLKTVETQLQGLLEGEGIWRFCTVRIIGFGTCRDDAVPTIRVTHTRNLPERKQTELEGGPWFSYLTVLKKFANSHGFHAQLYKVEEIPKFPGVW